MEHTDDKVQRDIETAVAIARIEVKLDTLCTMLDATEHRMTQLEKQLVERADKQKIWMSGWGAGVAFIVSVLAAFLQRIFF